MLLALCGWMRDNNASGCSSHKKDHPAPPALPASWQWRLKDGRRWANIKGISSLSRPRPFPMAAAELTTGGGLGFGGVTTDHAESPRADMLDSVDFIHPPLTLCQRPEDTGFTG